MTTIAEIHDELGFSEYEDRLREVGAVWRHLNALKRAKKIDAYRSYLKTAIDRLRSDDDDAYAEDVGLDKFEEFWGVYLAQREQRRAVAERRGMDFEGWCEKWLKKQWEEFGRAIDTYMDAPSGKHLAALSTSAKALCDAFDSAV